MKYVVSILALSAALYGQQSTDWVKDPNSEWLNAVGHMGWD